MIGVSKQLKRLRVSRVALVRKVNFGLDIDQSVENGLQLCGALDQKSPALGILVKRNELAIRQRK